MDLGVGVYLGVGHLKPKNEGYSDMDSSLDTATATGIRLIIFLKIIYFIIFYINMS